MFATVSKVAFQTQTIAKPAFKRVANYRNRPARPLQPTLSGAQQREQQVKAVMMEAARPGNTGIVTPLSFPGGQSTYRRRRGADFKTVAYYSDELTSSLDKTAQAADFLPSLKSRSSEKQLSGLYLH